MKREPGYDFGAAIQGAAQGLMALTGAAYLEQLDRAASLLASVLRGGGKILLCGNGGSAADAQHIAAELVGRYKVERRGLAAIALTTDSSVLTAWGNDYSFDTVFSRQVEALGNPGDLVWGISTSGNSVNVVKALEAARARGCATLGFIGRDGGAMRTLCDAPVVVPLSETARIQEGHMLSYHVLCEYLDIEFAAG